MIIILLFSSPNKEVVEKGDIRFGIRVDVYVLGSLRGWCGFRPQTSIVEEPENHD